MHSSSHYNININIHEHALPTYLHIYVAPICINDYTKGHAACTLQSMRFSTLLLPCGRVRLGICLQHGAVASGIQCPHKSAGPIAVLNIDRHRSIKIKKNMHRDCHLNICDPFPEDGSFTTPCHQFVLPPAALRRSVKRVLLPKFVQLHRKAVPIRDLLDVLGEIRC